MAQQSIKDFDRYRAKGAYHWQWYKTNKYSYADYAHKILGYLPNSGTVIDIGCGDGVMSYLLFKKGLKVTGIDPDETGITLGKQEISRQYFKERPYLAPIALFQGSMIDYLKKQGIQLRKESIYDVPDTQKFDYAVCQEVIEHVPEPQGMLEKVSKIVTQFALFTTPNGLYQKPKEHDYNFWKPEEFVDFLGRERAELLHVDETRVFARLNIQKSF